MTDQPFTLENHIAGPVYMDAPTAPVGQAADVGHGMFGALNAIGPMLHKVDFADLAKHAGDEVLNLVHGLDTFHVEAADHVAPAGEAVQNGVEAGMDSILVIPDDGYDCVDGELLVAEATDDAHEAQAVANHDDISGQPHDHDGAVLAHDASYDA